MQYKKNIILELKILTAHFTGVQKILTLCFTILMLSLANITSTSALSYQNDIGINFTFNPTISVSISNDLTIPNLTPGTTSDSNEINVNVSTNNVYGYNLYATVGNSTYNNTNLTNTNNNIDYIFTTISPTANLSSLDTDNTWGYSYSLDNGSNWSNYNGLSLYTTDNPTRLTKTTEPSSNTINFKIAAKSSTAQASGEYGNVINFTAITKLAPLTLSESYEAYYVKEGKTKLNGYYVMQDMNKEICENAEVVDSELQVIDNRDNKVYWIAKLRDGNCWMTQNLDLDLVSDPQAENHVALTSENTDLNDSTHQAYQNGYTTNEQDIITWTPNTSTLSNIEDWINNNDGPMTLNVDDIFMGNTTDAHTLTGNYYNWPSAIASNSNNNSFGDTYDSPNNNPKNSICPKGWRLPIITTYSNTAPGNNDFANLVYYYNNGNYSSTTNLKNAPLYLIWAGHVEQNYGIVHRNAASYYQSSSSKALLDAYRFFGSYSSNIGNNRKSYGMSIRCLAR